MTRGDFTTDNFTANLKLAVSYYPSVSEMCRKLGINRQQFMKYLAGTSFPSRHNLRRICDFFGIDEYEALMPHDQFRNIVRLRPNQGSDELDIPPILSSILSKSKRSHDKLTKTHGYYYKYYLSFSKPGHIIRSLTYVYPWKKHTLYKTLERLRRDGVSGTPDVYKYAGMVTIMGDRMHMLDKETITGAELTQTVLYMNYRNRVTFLTGLTVGVSGGDAHEPSASRVVMEFIGRSVNLRHAIAGCKLYDTTSPDISPQIRDHLSANGRIDSPLRAGTF